MLNSCAVGCVGREHRQRVRRRNDRQPDQPPVMTQDGRPRRSRPGSRVRVELALCALPGNLAIRRPAPARVRRVRHGLSGVGSGSASRRLEEAAEGFQSASLLIPRIDSRLLYVDHVVGCGVDVFPSRSDPAPRREQAAWLENRERRLWTGTAILQNAHTCSVGTKIARNLPVEASVPHTLATT